ncbi:hypothetical protein CJA_3683 [Cellvibrio japonicus Ueda107]|uniref:Uncharacterized protein n=1 Tax=Cellvibrio japonicus (strain Ueda107) TaxID=498211 RepID=B3PHU2_CELJU|nr:hypothetical protein CJA_3683 [Cellvibrio japonicus Ueda107]
MRARGQQLAPLARERIPGLVEQLVDMGLQALGGAGYGGVGKKVSQ